MQGAYGLAVRHAAVTRVALRCRWQETALAAPLYLLSVDFVRALNCGGLRIPLDALEHPTAPCVGARPSLLARARAGLAANLWRIAATSAFACALLYLRLGYLAQG